MWEFIGQLLTASAALFGLVYEGPNLTTLTATFGGVIGFSPAPAGAVGLAGLTIAGAGAFVGMVLGQIKPSDGNVGSAILFWTGFLVLVLGDALFYALQPSAPVAMLIGGAAAVLTSLGLLAIVQRPRGEGPEPSHPAVPATP